MKYQLLLVTVFSFVTVSVFANTQSVNSIQSQEKLKNIEESFGGKIGIYAVNTNNNEIIAYRADERFPVQSTMKLIGVAALLKKSQNNKNSLQQKVSYSKNDLIPWRPITGIYVNNGMTLEALAEAAMSYSDNTAINLIMKKLGGPKTVTDFASSIGNKSFNVSHYDGELNSDPNNAEDTATPKDMAMSVQKLTLGNILLPSQRTQLVTWMRNNTTGNKRIRAGVPIGWTVAEKTGGGFGGYGIANDIGILWSPLSKPIVLAIYTVQNNKNAKNRDDIVAATTTIVMDEFAINDPLFKALFS